MEAVTDSRFEHSGTRSEAFATTATALIVGLLLAAAVWMFDGTPASAYDQYSTDQTDNCAACHGDFRASGYVSNADGVAWTGGASLHNGHRTNMLSGDCNVCHGTLKFPVPLSSSAGGTGFPVIGCLGCHGRAEPAAGGAVKAAGLRQHHYRSGVTLCVTCHSDANPASFATAPETVKPPYYFTPDAAHPSKPTDPCNGNGSESSVAPPLGLDNDGDLVYDAADCATAAVEGPTAFQFTLEGLRPNPSRGELLRVAFVLPSSAAARLELLDVSGRRVLEREVGALGAGRHVVDLAAGQRLAQGLYLVRLTQGTNTRTSRVAVLK